MAENEQTEVTNVRGSEETNVEMTVAEGQAAKPAEGPTADSLGVTDEQFAKYYKDGQYNWEAHAKEQQFKAEQKGEDKTEDAPKVYEGEINEETVPTILADAGLDAQAIADKVMATGDIDDADYAALEKIGVTPKMASDYLDEIVHGTQAHVDAVMEVFGGFDKAVEVMQELTRRGVIAEDAYDDASRALADPRTGLAFAKGLMAQYQSGSNAPMTSNRLYGDAQSSQSPQGYQSQAEMIAEMRDPRYKKDPAFRAQVMSKVQAATFADPTKRHTGGL